MKNKNGGKKNKKKLTIIIFLVLSSLGTILYLSNRQLGLGIGLGIGLGLLCRGGNNESPLPLVSFSQLDAVSFKGGGIRAPTHDFAFILYALRSLRKTVPELFKNTKYFGSNSGGSWTNAVLMAYPQIDFPLDKIASEGDEYWKTFYYDKWLKIVEEQVPKGTLAFRVFSLDNQAEYSWLNGLADFFMLPFKDSLYGIKLKDAQFAKDENKVVTFAGSVLYDSYIRNTIPTNPLTNPVTYVEYTWQNTLRTPVSSDTDKIVEGGPVNLIFGYNNIEKVPIRRFNLDPSDSGKVTYQSFSSQNPTNPIQTTSARDVQNPSVSGTGEMDIFVLSALSSAGGSVSQTPFCLTNVLGSGTSQSPSSEELVLANYTEFNKSIIYNVNEDTLLENSGTQVQTGLPQNPFIDNGQFTTEDFNGSNVLLNLGDGVPFSNNSGLTSIILAIQSYETDQERTYNLLYVGNQGKVPSCIGPELGFDYVFTSLFGLDFKDPKSTFTDGMYVQNDFLGNALPNGVVFRSPSPQIFESSEFTAYTACPGARSISCDYDTEKWPGLDAINTGVRIVQFLELTTIENKAFGIKPGWKFNIEALLLYSDLNTFIDVQVNPFAPVKKTNQKLMAQLENLDSTSNWIHKLFGHAE